jgi:hypothetical protein
MPEPLDTKNGAQAPFFLRAKCLGLLKTNWSIKVKTDQ